MKYIVYKDDYFYGSGSLEHIQSLIRDWLSDHMSNNYEATFRVVEKHIKTK
ncbi:hypothetical protein P4159_05885 [Bacillus thuringiensis]|uniref:hypothetical protein n=1 Tax=Bacillus cereus group TaxID=86661 RepID=UPI0015599D4D|nr:MULTISPECIES: hypothetical protein [Bacillus cereus group]MEC3417058.1 hypothetical protein [Bacillus cereus]MEC3596962.1 hypothetical protein [Bacillus thuringiensis]MED1574311.1 hypothetical protein [Bacillus paranthracis]MED1836235.1 hypothetical protein [Bacillus thuringiensis]MED2670213.1 hypothetical protein [Bacillus thuringiensis]